MSPCIPENSMPFHQKIKSYGGFSSATFARKIEQHSRCILFWREQGNLLWSSTLVSNFKSNKKSFKEYNTLKSTIWNKTTNSTTSQSLHCFAPKTLEFFLQNSIKYQKYLSLSKNSNLHVLLQSALAHTTSELFIKHQNSKKNLFFYVSHCKEISHSTDHTEVCATFESSCDQTVGTKGCQIHSTSMFFCSFL